MHSLRIKPITLALLQECFYLNVFYSDMYTILAESQDELPMSKRRDEVQAAVDTVILDVLPVQAAFIPKILFKLQVNIVSNGLPAED